MPSSTPATYQADEHLAQHLLHLGFVETTIHTAAAQAAGVRRFHHLERGLCVRLSPNRIALEAGAHWRFETYGLLRAETLDFLLTACVSPMMSKPCSLPELGYQHLPYPTLSTTPQEVN